MNNLIYYSVNTVLANFINKEYYKDIHYIWAAPYFDPIDENPSSSNPKVLYENLVKDLKGRKIDYHSKNVLGNRIGIKKGAIEREKQGYITQEMREEIIELSETASFELFEPLLYIIPASLVSERVIKPHFRDKAHPTSVEYIIEDLKGAEFDTIQL